MAQLAKKYQVPVIALAGMDEDDLTLLYEQGVTAVFAIADRPIEPERIESACRRIAGCNFRTDHAADDESVKRVKRCA